MESRYLEVEAVGLSVDLRTMRLPHDVVAAHLTRLRGALAEMAALEDGAIANQDEGRQVGHYWLRAPRRAPEEALEAAIVEARDAVREVAASVPPDIEHVVHIGIGGSALGPQLLTAALAPPPLGQRMLHFLDNTDPDTAARLMATLPLEATWVVVVSKSGGTVETMNALAAVRSAFEAHGLSLAERAVAITGEGSRLHQLAVDEGWAATLPMWDWVGGRTSITSAVGLLPGALAGVDVESFLVGAAAMDRATRREDPHDNPAAMMALSWLDATGGCAKRAMVVLPYRDRLALFPPYLQQLVMESLGKRFDRNGRIVNQGLTVFGNKGSTDQHAYVQQLREGPDDHFVCFVEVLRDGRDVAVDGLGDVTMGDYLSGFLAGTRRALDEVGRRSLTVTLDRLDAKSLGALVALFERAVGLYASLVGINAYHQPGVEAGKKAAQRLLEVQKRLLELLRAGIKGDAVTLAAMTGAEPEDAFHILRHLAANGRAVSDGRGLAKVFAAPPD